MRDYRRTTLALANADELDEDPDVKRWRLRADAVIVTTGRISQANTVLGPASVSVDPTAGGQAIDALLRPSLAVATTGLTPGATEAEAFDLLNVKAVALYGDAVDAVVNATFHRFIASGAV